MTYPKLGVASMRAVAQDLLGEDVTPTVAMKDYDVLLVTEEGLSFLGTSGRAVRFASTDEDSIHVSIRRADGTQESFQVARRPDTPTHHVSFKNAGTTVHASSTEEARMAGARIFGIPEDKAHWVSVRPHKEHA